MTKKILVNELLAQINGIWGNFNMENYNYLVKKKPE